MKSVYLHFISDEIQLNTIRYKCKEGYLQFSDVLNEDYKVSDDGGI